jgi:hypothetical protein
VAIVSAEKIEETMIDSRKLDRIRKRVVVGARSVG